MPTGSINPTLSDVLQSALQKAAGKTAPPPEDVRVVVHGNHNIISYGGQVHVTAAVFTPSQLGEL